ncbi:Heme d1 biosynthesis protein NirF [hydrothermal vent metagenome]|uniref:Heme d1 biosynthesis protein NirF n=1 Tax=hydrothermal vent metagenome TaxID=652676 RepID=A0A3B0YHK9_9ZZZZ
MKIKLILTGLLLINLQACSSLRATGDLGLIIERASGSVQLIETTGRSSLSRIEGMGDLSHASIVYSRDERYAYIFGRDGGLSKIDLLKQKLVKRIMQSGNSIGGAISQDGKLVAVSNYTPGGVKVFAADSLKLVAEIPASYIGSGQSDNKGSVQQQSKVVGLVDAPGRRFVFSLYDAGEIWIADFSESDKPEVTKFKSIGKQPYDGLISPDGRYYIAGLFGEDGLALVDLWHTEKGVMRILKDYGKGHKKLPVYKMPHLEGWAMAGDYAFLPAVGRHQVLVVERKNWQVVKRIEVHGQPVFVMASPDQRHVWVNFAFPDNDTLQVVDVDTLEIVKQLTPGKAVLHMEFTPRGENVWVSVRDENKVNVYDTANYKLLKTLPVKKPSGIFFTTRAHKTGL